MFRFSIRDVLWLTVVVAVLVAWWIEHTATAAEHSEKHRATVAHAEKLRSALQAAEMAYSTMSVLIARQSNQSSYGSEPDWSLAAEPIPD